MNLLLIVKCNILFVSKVTVLTPSFPRYPGDYHGVFIEGLCDQLAKHVALEVIAPRTRTMKPKQHEYSVLRFPYMPDSRMEYIAEATMKNAPTHILAALPLYLASAYLHLIKSRADLIHTHLAIPMGFLGAFNPRGTSQLITCHGSDITYPIEKPYLRSFLKQTLRRADYVVAVSRYIEKLAVKLGANPARTETIYLGVDLKRFHPTEKRKELTIGTLGRLVREKNIHELLYAVKELRDKIDIRVRIGGDGPDQYRLIKLAEKLQLDVEFTGRVYDPVEFHRSLDVFVLTSTREGLSMSLQEAMACAACPVTVNTASSREIIEEGVNGYLYDSGDHEMLCTRILDAVNRGELAQSARETIETRFNSETATRRYLQLYEELGIFLKDHNY